jgi:hypothetical protein
MVLPPPPRPPIRFPIRTPWAQKLPLHQPRNPGVLRPPPHSTHQPPPSSITPEPIPRRRRPPQPQPQRPPRLVVEAEAEPSVPEPVQPRRPAPHRCRSNFATLHRTGAVPATPSFAASDLLPLRQHTATATQSTIWPWVRPSLHPPPKHRFPRQKEEDRRDMWRRPHWQPEMVLLFPYSCKSYVSACTVFIPQKTLVDRFFLILDVPSYSRCTRFLLIYYFTLARGPSPPGFQFLVS